MAFRLPRLPRGIAIVDKLGVPIQSFQAWWQSVVSQIEVQETAQDGIIADLTATQADLAAAQADLTAAQADIIAITGDLTTLQPLDATLTALAGLDASTGLVEQTGADTFTKRAMGVAAGTSVLTRADGDGRYAAVSVGGTVTSVAMSVPSFLSVAGSPVTTTGALAVTLSGTALPAANGGTGLTSLGSGIATFLGTPSSANLAAALTDEIGTGKAAFGTAKTAWTPRLAIGGSSAGITYTAQDGYYARVGDIVTASLRIILSSKGAGTGSVTIEDLPFTVGSNGAAPLLVTGFTNQALATCLPNNATTQIIIYAATGSAYADTDINNTTSFYVTATYVV